MMVTAQSIMYTDLPAIEGINSLNWVANIIALTIRRMVQEPDNHYLQVQAR